MPAAAALQCLGRKSMGRLSTAATRPMETTAGNEECVDREESTDFFISNAAKSAASCDVSDDGGLATFEMRLDLKTVTEPYLRYGISTTGEHCESATFEMRLDLKTVTEPYLRYGISTTGEHCESATFEMRLDLKTVTEPYLRYGISTTGEHCESAWRISEEIFQSWKDLVTDLDLKPRGMIPNLDEKYPFWESINCFETLGMRFKLFVGLVKRNMVLLAVEGEVVTDCGPWATI
ncbi:hypothetical protein BDN71DRAFT_1589595 [Pleurotus eryngii]|uniref:Uncharacterized protein n=1 Tax=Pleurotus eryngii TaxID=5323 RepID=A0A9P5ZY67_PLEER|nr:hypothetical protein BDN71DRAFT_1589595 [Pleurotus eryngii]